MKSPAHRVVLLGLAFASSSCNKPSVDLNALEDRVSDLETSVRKQKQVTSGFRDELARAESLLDKAKEQSSATLAEIDEAKKTVEEVKAEFDKYRSEYKAWVFQHGPGMKFPELSAVGRTFKSVTIKSVNDWELVFLHDGGVARLSLADAAKELQDRFAYVPGTVKPVITTSVAASGTGSNTGSINVAAPPGSSSSSVATSDTDSAAAYGLPPGAVGAKPGTITTDSTGKRHYMTTESGQVVEILGSIEGYNASPNHIGRVKSNAAEGYKPIGSSFGKSNLGK